MPWGNWFLCEQNGDGATKHDERLRMLGPFLALLSDDVIVSRLLSTLDAVSLARFGQVNRACYAMSRHDELWRALCTHAFSKAQSNAPFSAPFSAPFRFVHSWMATYAVVFGRLDERSFDVSERFRPMRVDGVYSDVLYAPWRCYAVDLRGSWLSRDNVMRVDAIGVDEFVERFERCNRPVVIDHVVDRWPASERWAPSALLERFANRTFTAGPLDMSMAHYLEYAEATRDELPFYLFDKRFGEQKRAPGMLDDYAVPAYFADDLFDLLPDDVRPAHRWLVVGPPRSGSRFHQDPNATSAWNAVVRGRKKWIMFPPDCVPPGVFPSADGATVTSPLTLLEWFLNFYEQAREHPRCTECIVRAGQVIFVPSGWWHLVINVDFSVAVTQNFCSPRTLPRVLRFLDEKADQISGIAGRDSSYRHDASALQVARESLHSIFLDQLRRHRPELLAQSDKGEVPVDQEKNSKEKQKQTWQVCSNDPFDQHQSTFSLASLLSCEDD
jgi:Cupin-like domain